VTPEHLPIDPPLAPASVVAPHLDPSAYLGEWIGRDGSAVTIRPIRPEDEPKMVRFHQSLSERSVYLRYFHCLSLDARVTHERLTRVCFVDYDRATVLVAESSNGDIVAVGRLAREPASPDDAEFALLVSDAWHEHGLGTELLRRLISLARDEGIHRVFGDILAENDAMQKVCRQLGFELHYLIGEGVVKASINVGEIPRGDSVYCKDS
jgi:acetyltransferase